MTRPRPSARASSGLSASTQRYGAAIRKVRERRRGAFGSEVDGLTERQLRRIEQGQSRATTGAITALATAHGLDANAYMDRLTKAMA